FPAEDLWTIRSVPVPAPGAVSTMDVVSNRHGTELRFRGINGANSRVGPRRPNHPPCAHVVYTNLPETVHFQIVSGVDERGRNVVAGGSSGESNNYYFELKLPADSRTVDLTFAITKRVSLQYLVKPSRLSAAELEQLIKR